MKTLCAIIALTLVSAGPALAQVSLSAGAPSVVPISPVQIRHTFKYSARFICVNPSPFLAAGTYTTDIGIHNPQDESVSFQKKAMITQTEDVEIGPVSRSVNVSLTADTGIHIDCSHIVTEFFLGIPAANVVTGYVVITSPRELDVTAAYTATFISSGS